VQLFEAQVSFLISTELLGLAGSVRGNVGNSHDMRRSEVHEDVMVSSALRSVRLELESWQPENTQLHWKMRVCTSAAVGWTGVSVPQGPPDDPPEPPPLSPHAEKTRASDRRRVRIVG
jgi:hypothetical protein